jgi:hypothetical protein
MENEDLKSLAFKALQGNREGNQRETDGFLDGNSEGNRTPETSEETEFEGAPIQGNREGNQTPVSFPEISSEGNRVNNEIIIKKSTSQHVSFPVSLCGGETRETGNLAKCSDRRHCWEYAIEACAGTAPLRESCGGPKR